MDRDVNEDVTLVTLNRDTDTRLKIEAALQKMLSFTNSVKKTERVLLYDESLPTEIIGFLKGLKEPRTISNEKYFRGSERDAVIYIGARHLESFSRAKLLLGIITFCCDPCNRWYSRYTKALIEAEKLNLLRKIG